MTPGNSSTAPLLLETLGGSSSRRGLERSTKHPPLLFGRDRERQALQVSLKRMLKKRATLAVWLEGPSGSGKSALVASTLEHAPPLRKHQCLYATGKFDLPHEHDPASSKTGDDETETAIGLLRSAYSAQSTTPSLRDLMNKKSMRSGAATVAEEVDATMDQSSAQSTTNELQQTLLYQGIRAALGQVCQQLLNLTSGEESGKSHDDNNPIKRKTRQEAQTALNIGLDASSWQVLEILIPNLAALRSKWDDEVNSAASSISAMTQDTFQKGSSLNIDFSNFKELADRFKLASRRFLQTVSHFLPLVLVLDDLQWADPSSLNLLSSWIQDTDNGALLIVGCYRSEDPASGAVRKMIAGARGDSHGDLSQTTTAVGATSVIPMQTIILRDLGLSEIEDMLDSLLSVSDLGSTVSLADILVRKTKGNGFFVVKLLQYLNEHQLLLPHDHHHHQSKNLWDEDAIREACESIDDVASLISLTLEQPENKVPRALLPIVACIGMSSFTSSILFRVLNNMSKDDFKSFSKHQDAAVSRPADMASMTRQLDECVERGFLTRTGPSIEQSLQEEGRESAEYNFRFVHDQVQIASLNLLNKDERVKLQFKIGESLLSSCDPKELDEMIFAILDLLNPRATKLRSSNPKRMEIAKLNARAGSQAMRSSSFPIACWYIRRAISLLPPNRWEDQYYQDTLQMYTAGAIAESLGGDAEAMLWYADRVRQHGRNIMDKIPIFHMLMDWFLDQDRASESFDMGCRVMEYLGGSIPTQGLHVKGSTLTGLLKTKKMVNKYMSTTDVQELPIVTDAKELAVMTTLDKLGTAAYLQRKKLVPVIIFKGVRKTFKNGITPHAAPFLAAYGYAMTNHLGDFAMGKKCGEKALELLSKDKRVDVRARTKAIVYGVNLHFMTPIGPLHESYLEGLQSGDFRNAMFSVALHLQALFACGKSLSLIEGSCRVAMKVFQDFKQPHFVGVLRGMWQGYLNLIGDHGNTTILTGSVMDQAQVLNNKKQQDEMSAAMARRLQMNLRRVQLNLAVFFGEFKHGADMAVECGDEILDKLRGQIASVTLQFDGAYCCYRMAQYLTSSATASSIGGMRRRYLKYATRAHKRIKDLVAKMNPNCRHYCALLDAEVAILNGSDPMVVTHHLDEALAFAAKDEMIHDQALILERYANFWRSQDEEFMTNFRIRAMNALTLYQRWGAHAKVSHLKKEWAHLLGAYLKGLPEVDQRSETMDMSVSSISDSYW